LTSLPSSVLIGSLIETDITELKQVC